MVRHYRVRSKFGWGLVLARLSVLTVASSAMGSSALAITADDLKTMLSESPRPVVVDIRARARYDQAHIPGAISIPAASLAQKAVPPFGRVVVYGDGVDETTMWAAVDALNRIPGIEAVVLEGGFPAWEAQVRVTSRGAGRFDEVFEYLSSEDLVRVASKNRDVVLVDLRPPQSSSGGASAAAGVDLASRFPRHKTLAPDPSRWHKYRAGAIGAGELLRFHRLSPGKLYVLIDQGDGATAEAVARSLRGRGIRRVAILAGGDRVMRPEGQPGTATRTFPEK
jgi:3-mercaptopyruvate sulfurtransferase SseA